MQRSRCLLRGYPKDEVPGYLCQSRRHRSDSCQADKLQKHDRTGESLQESQRAKRKCNHPTHRPRHRQGRRPERDLFGPSQRSRIVLQGLELPGGGRLEDDAGKRQRRRHWLHDCPPGCHGRCLERERRRQRRAHGTRQPLVGRQRGERPTRDQGGIHTDCRTFDATGSRGRCRSRNIGAIPGHVGSHEPENRIGNSKQQFSKKPRGQDRGPSER
mmetsp:Transcript_30312/g.65030  ORF Transcript_30312/g.65030 Transcript_30312/m.65030 type:complete len:215 (+) Transcript_30312:427-1071(+)